MCRIPSRRSMVRIGVEAHRDDRRNAPCLHSSRPSRSILMISAHQIHTQPLSAQSLQDVFPSGIRSGTCFTRARSIERITSAIQRCSPNDIPPVRYPSGSTVGSCAATAWRIELTWSVVTSSFNSMSTRPRSPSATLQGALSTLIPYNVG